jgi:flagellar basal-body rod protein FlgG
MLKSLYTTATGMKAQQTMVDMIANNIANVNTAGFKKSQASFEDLLYVTLQSPGANGGGSASARPIGTEIGSGTRLSGTTKVHTAGTLEITDRALDIAIDGDGFFEVILPDGTSGYTRDGSFQVNADGKLVTSAGYVLTPEITVPQDVLEISIDPEGRVGGRTASTPDSQTIFGQMQISKFLNPSGMLSVGSNIAMKQDASGEPVVGPPGQNGLGLLKQGFIERSNVQIVNELVNLIVAQRAYEVNSRAIQASDQMLSTATNLSR